MNLNNALFLIAVPLVFAFSSPLISMISKKANSIVLLFSVIFNFAFAFNLMKIVNENGPQIAIIGGWKPPFGINLYVSYISLFFLLLAYAMIIVSVLIFLAKKKKEHDDKIVSVIYLFMTSITGVILTGDLFNMFVFFEIFTIATIILIAMKGTAVSLKGAMKYAILSSISSAFFLFAIAVIYGSLGTLNIAEIGLRFSELSPVAASFVFIMFFAALLPELEMFPFNMWVADSYEGSFNYVNILLSSVASITAMYALMRIFITGFSYPLSGIIRVDVPFNARFLMAFIGSFTAIAGELSALSSRNIKRMLAFSSIGQMGIIITGIGIGTIESIGGALFLLLNLSIAKSVLFISTGAMLKGSADKSRDALTGIFSKEKIMPLFFILGALSVVGAPFTIGFYGKLFIVQSLSEIGKVYYLFMAVIFAGAVIELFYYFRIIHLMFAKNESERMPKINILYYAAAAVTASFAVYFIFNPHSLQQFVYPAVNELFDKIGYIKDVLGTGVLK